MLPVTAGHLRQLPPTGWPKAGLPPKHKLLPIQLPKHLQQENYRYGIHYCICTLSQANSAWRA